MNRQSVVLVDSDFADCDVEREAAEAAGLHFVDARTMDDETRSIALRGAAGLLVQYATIDRPLIESSPGLRVIVPYGVGTDMIDVRAALEHGVDVQPVVDYCVDEVADHAMALVLASLRRIVPLSSAVRCGGWPTTDDLGHVRTLARRRFAVVGFGSIGRAVIRRARAFGALPVAHDPFVDAAVIRDAGATPASIEDAFRCDVVSLHLPLTDATRGMVSTELLALLPDGALLVNVARGGVVDEAALRSELDAGRIAAALDVFSIEPPPAGHPLVAAPNTLVTPHAAWYSDNALTELRQRAAAAVIAGMNAERSVR